MRLEMKDVLILSFAVTREKVEAERTIEPFWHGSYVSVQALLCPTPKTWLKLTLSIRGITD